MLSAGNFARAIRAVSDEPFVEVRGIETPLRLALRGNGENPLARLEVDNLQGVVIQCCGEQPPALHVNSKMIHSPLDIAHWNGLNEAQGVLILRVDPRHGCD